MYNVCFYSSQYQLCPRSIEQGRTLTSYFHFPSPSSIAILNRPSLTGPPYLLAGRYISVSLARTVSVDSSGGDLVSASD
jgi:hypothetical protein